ncbi:MAG: adenylate/guanylate cyclase domain-containing protein [Bacteroidetes bacterium]|nr:MAG: adenylate/guanylate cyclase domain-containing protein [Bacteroidota bacterium]
MRPRIKYAQNGDVNIAYSVMGTGPVDLVMVPGWVSNIGLHDDHPTVARFFNELASFARVIQFDKRGTGLSDRPTAYATLEERVADLLAVLDAVGSVKVALFGWSEGGSMSILFAAMHPELTHCLITFGAFAKRLRSNKCPWAPTLEERDVDIKDFVRSWSSPRIEDYAASVASDAAAVDWFTRYLQGSASPAAAHQIHHTNTHINVCDVLPTIHVPTMIMHRTGDPDSTVEEGRWIADQIPGAGFRELPGEDHVPYFGDIDRVVSEVKAFVQTATDTSSSNRVLSTIVFVDIVQSTALASRLGDREWRQKWERFVELSQKHIAETGGRLVKHTGDGFLALYAGPANAVKSGLAFLALVEETELSIRTGIHTGEIEIIGEDIGGVGVHITARVMDAADTGEVVVSSTVKDITAGAGLNLEDIGERELKGVPGTWRLFRAL